MKKAPGHWPRAPGKKQEEKMKNALLLAGCIVACYLAGGIGAVFTSSSIPTWYAGLQKPPLNPPNWIFGPVWSLLYTLMAIAVFLVIRNGIESQAIKLAAGVFIAQLILNTLWSVVFFGARNTFAPIFIIAALWACILACIILFWGISKPASVMMMPYILWVSFAAYLNIGVFVLNR
jgi:benzodiazapine receptor